MTSRGNWDRETGRLLKRIDIPDLSDQLDVVRDYLQELASSFSKIANRQWRNTRDRTLDTVEGTSEIMKRKSRRLFGCGVGSRLADRVSNPSWR